MQPSSPMIAPSITMLAMMRLLLQPIAIMMPVSRVRSWTAIRSTLRTLRPAMVSAMIEIACDTALRISRLRSLREQLVGRIDADIAEALDLSADLLDPLGRNPGLQQRSSTVTWPARKDSSCRSASGMTMMPRFTADL